jgi:formylglycine-generating enzyme required for sulfatase activity
MQDNHGFLFGSNHSIEDYNKKVVRMYNQRAQSTSQSVLCHSSLVASNLFPTTKLGFIEHTAMTLNPGQILNNRYRIVKLLGQGGFGAVYRAWDTNLDGPVALKENLDTSPTAQRQFQLEARLLFRLAHPNLPHVTDHFVISGQGQYLVMDFIEGDDLQAMLNRAGGPLPEALILPWITQVCEALSYLHLQNPPVIHRDIKPANIKITPQGQAVLVDFGIAKVYDPTLRTTVGARAVTPGYSPMEQYGKGGRTDARTDVYALGATLYHLLTGREPEDAPGRNLGAALPAPRSLNPALSPWVEAAILQAMAMLPADRFQSAAAFQATLSLASQQGVVAGGNQVVKTSTAPILSTARQRLVPWAWMGIVGALLLAVVTLLVAALTGGGSGTDRIATQTLLTIATTGGMTATEEGRPTEGLSTESSLLLSPMPLPSEILVTFPSNTPTALSTETATPIPSGTSTLRPPTALPPRRVDSRGVRMALILAGEFQMGNENWGSEEKPAHTIYLDTFYIDIYEVTNSLYATCQQAGACTPPRYISSSRRSSYYGNAEYNDYPVIYVDWEQARTFCEWRDARLPTEAEWEKAARGGLEGKDYPWGDEAVDCSQANYGGTKGCVGDTSKVGHYTPNGYGLYDMVGNVWEWVWDWYSESYYSSSPLENPLGPELGKYRVVRGGSWFSYRSLTRCAYRSKFTPDLRLNDIGFRCARMP